MRAKIFIISEWYVPAVKAGGSVTALSKLIDALGDRFEFYLLTGDRDLGDRLPFQDVPTNRWLEFGKTRVLYATDPSARQIRKCLNTIRPDLIYLNSCFSILTRRTLLLKRFGLIPLFPIVVAPRGEFSVGAMNLKRLRKELYLRLANRISFFNGIVWHASSGSEQADITRVVSRFKLQKTVTSLANELPDITWLEAKHSPTLRNKCTGSAKILFLSRISRKKNLEFALDALQGISGNVTLDLYGPIEDLAYWKLCQRRIRALPENVTVRYCGSLKPTDVAKVSEKYQFLILPTLGENFCYVVPETMAAGCVPLVSDRTPWQNLESHGAGWVLPLENPQAWLDQLNRCVAMGSEEFSECSANAKRYVSEWASSQTSAAESIALFESVLPANSFSRTADSRQQEDARCADA